MTPSKQRALAVEAKARALENKVGENKRAYQRRKERERLKELHRLSGVETYLTRTAEETKTPKFLHGIHLAKKGRRPERITQNLPCANTFIPIREYYDTPEDRAEVARILAKK